MELMNTSVALTRPLDLRYISAQYFTVWIRRRVRGSWSVWRSSCVLSQPSCVWKTRSPTDASVKTSWPCSASASPAHHHTLTRRQHPIRHVRTKCYLLAQLLKKQGLGMSTMDYIFNAIVLNKILYALPVYFGYFILLIEFNMSACCA